MEQADQQLQSNQETRQMGQDPDAAVSQDSSLDVEGKDKKLLKILTYVLASIVLVAFGGFSFWFYQKKISKKPTYSPGFSPSPVSKEIPTPTSGTIPAVSETEIRGKVVFVRDGDIFVISPDGSEEKRLTTYGANWAPVFSPNGEWIAYSSLPKELERQEVAPTPSNVWIIRPNGSEARKLSKEPRVIGTIVWSPDSKKIAFSTADTSIAIIDIETGVTQEFIKDAGPAGIVAADPVWLTSSTLIYKARLPNSPNEAGIALADTQKQTIEWLIQKPYITNVLSFSNGRKLLCLFEEAIWQIDVASKTMEKLDLDIPEDIWFNGNLKLSPTEDRLIGAVGFKSEGPAPPEQKLTFIIIDIKSGNIDLMETGLKFWGGLDWSSDGSWLILNGIPVEEKIATEEEIIQSDLWRVNIQTQTKEKLTDNAQSPNWFFKE